MRRGILGHREGVCPNCESTEFDDQIFDDVDEFRVYSMTCTVCHAEIREWYKCCYDETIATIEGDGE